MEYLSPSERQKTKEKNGTSITSAPGLTSDLRETRDKMMEAIRKPEIGSRDLATLSAAIVKLDNQLAASREDVWWSRVKELKQASEAIEDLNIGSSESYAKFFDNGKKKAIFLVE